MKIGLLPRQSGNLAESALIQIRPLQEVQRTQLLLLSQQATVLRAKGFPSEHEQKKKQKINVNWTFCPGSLKTRQKQDKRAQSKEKSE